MPTRPYDAVGKTLLEARPADLWPLLGLPDPPPPVRVVDADLSTVTGAADKVIHVQEAFAGNAFWILHAEPQGNHDLTILTRLPFYKFSLERRHKCSVASVLMLLREEADSPQITGTIERRDRLGKVSKFEYTVIRVWQLPVERLLTGGLGLLALAPLASVEREAIPEVVARMQTRVNTEIAEQAVRVEFWVAVNVSMGLRYRRPGEVANWLRGVHGMEESVTYREIAQTGERRGRLEQARATLLSLGSVYIGPPDEPTPAAVNSVPDLTTLDRMILRAPRARSWAEVLAEPE